MLRDTRSLAEESPLEITEFAILDLPQELLLYICSFLSVQDIAQTLPLVCKIFLCLSKDNILWKNFYAIDFPRLQAVTINESNIEYKKIYQQCVQDFENFYPIQGQKRQCTSVWLGEISSILSIFQTLESSQLSQSLPSPHYAITYDLGPTDKTFPNLSFQCHWQSPSCSIEETEQLNTRSSCFVVIKNNSAYFPDKTLSIIETLSARIKMKPFILLAVLEIFGDEWQRGFANQNIDKSLKEAIDKVDGIYLAITLNCIESLIAALNNITYSTASSWSIWAKKIENNTNITTQYESTSARNIAKEGVPDSYCLTM